MRSRVESPELRVESKARRWLLYSFLFWSAILVAGCAIWPSTWRIGGSPLDKHERTEARLDAARADAVGGAQAAVHKAEAALQAAPVDSRPVSVAKDFVAEARALLDQARGAPTASDVTAWRELVAGLLSENAAVRAEAERTRASQAATTADLARRLAAATAKAERSEARALEYARDREALADFAAKLKLGFFALVGMFVLGSVLSIASRFVPALGLASKVVNGVVAPGITFAAHRAELGLQRVGQGMARLRTLTDKAEDYIERAFDGVTDADHQAMIARAAIAAQLPSATGATPGG
jgi:hypothetical protein